MSNAEGLRTVNVLPVVCRAMARAGTVRRTERASIVDEFKTLRDRIGDWKAQEPQ